MGFDGWQGEMQARMTADRADYVRRLRVDEAKTWRAVAQACAAAWDQERWAGNKSAGMSLCRAAADYFDEDWTRPPWN